MAKKAELLEKAAELKLAVSEKNTIAEIEAAIAEAESGAPENSKPHEIKDKDVIAEREAVVAKAGNCADEEGGPTDVRLAARAKKAVCSAYDSLRGRRRRPAR